MFLTKKYILFYQKVYTFCQKSIYVLRERYNRSEKKVYLFWGEGVIVLQNCKLFSCLSSHTILLFYAQGIGEDKLGKVCLCGMCLNVDA